MELVGQINTHSLDLIHTVKSPTVVKVLELMSILHLKDSCLQKTYYCLDFRTIILHPASHFLNDHASVVIPPTPLL